MDMEFGDANVFLTDVDQIKCKFSIGDDEEFGPGWEFTNVFKLASESKSMEPLRVDVNNLLLLVHLYTKLSQPDDASSRFSLYSKSGKGQGSTTYERMMTCWDPFSPEGSNVVVLFIGRGQNMNLFNKFINERDTGGFSECAISCCLFI